MKATTKLSKTQKGKNYIYQVIEIETGRILATRTSSRDYVAATFYWPEEGATALIENGFGRLDLVEPGIRSNYFAKTSYMGQYNIGDVYSILEGKRTQIWRSHPEPHVIGELCLAYLPGLAPGEESPDLFHQADLEETLQAEQPATSEAEIIVDSCKAGIVIQSHLNDAAISGDQNRKLFADFLQNTYSSEERISPEAQWEAFDWLLRAERNILADEKAQKQLQDLAALIMGRIGPQPSTINWITLAQNLAPEITNQGSRLALARILMNWTLEPTTDPDPEIAPDQGAEVQEEEPAAEDYFSHRIPGLKALDKFLQIISQSTEPGLAQLGSEPYELWKNLRHLIVELETGDWKQDIQDLEDISRSLDLEIKASQELQAQANALEEKQQELEKALEQEQKLHADAIRQLAQAQARIEELGGERWSNPGDKITEPAQVRAESEEMRSLWSRNNELILELQKAQERIKELEAGPQPSPLLDIRAILNTARASLEMISDKISEALTDEMRAMETRNKDLEEKLASSTETIHYLQDQLGKLEKEIRSELDNTEDRSEQEQIEQLYGNYVSQISSKGEKPALSWENFSYLLSRGRMISEKGGVWEISKRPIIQDFQRIIEPSSDRTKTNEVSPELRDQILEEIVKLIPDRLRISTDDLGTPYLEAK